MRRIWRDIVHPLLWLIAVTALIGAALGTTIAHAEPLTVGEQFAAEHGVDLCLSLDQQPTVPGVLAVLLALETTGLSTHESGIAVVTSVTTICPIHAPLLHRFVAHYRGDRTL